MDRLGLGYEALRRRNSKLIYCSISGYGQNGPMRDEPAMDLVVQASSGLMSVTGTTEGRHVRAGHSVADTTAGLFGMIGILMALRVREQTGTGQYVDISMLDVMVSTMASNFANYCGLGKVPRPMGTSFAAIVPYRTFPTADREIALAIGSEKLWASFCDLIGFPDMACHREYATNALRVRNRAKLEDMLIDIFRRRPAAEWIRQLLAVGIPCSLVRNVDEVFASPQLAARGMFPVLEHPTAGLFPVTGPPVKLSETPGSVQSAAPRLGEHTRTVLRDLLHLDDSEIEKLASHGVIPCLQGGADI
jgi:crotonobetainyl-CoA:carnitine CoA-transferase CaiB-like acyl-CoA transferase